MIISEYELIAFGLGYLLCLELPRIIKLIEWIYDKYYVKGL